VKKCVSVALLFFLASFSMGVTPGIGEKMTFSMWYNFIKVGVSYLEVNSLDTINGRGVYRVVYQVRSTGMFDKIFKVRDFFESWIDVREYFSYGFAKSVHEGKYRKEYSVRFNYDKMVAVAGEDTMAIDGYLSDPVSVFYYVRALNLEEGKEFFVKSFDNNKIRQYKIVVIGVKRLVMPYGEEGCFVLAPFHVDGSPFKYGGHAVIYVSIKRKIPVVLETRFKFGTVKMKLEKYQEGE